MNLVHRIHIHTSEQFELWEATQTPDTITTYLELIDDSINNLHQARVLLMYLKTLLQKH